jgi:hypothetical protein
MRRKIKKSYASDISNINLKIEIKDFPSQFLNLTIGPSWIRTNVA